MGICAKPTLQKWKGRKADLSIKVTEGPVHNGYEGPNSAFIYRGPTHDSYVSPVSPLSPVPQRCRNPFPPNTFKLYNSHHRKKVRVYTDSEKDGEENEFADATYDVKPATHVPPALCYVQQMDNYDEVMNSEDEQDSVDGIVEP